jgi:enoyl-CoA hydratase
VPYRTLIYEKTERVGVITLNRPERLNALNYEMAAELAQVLNEIAKDRAIRTVILTGTGRAFCAGVDIKEMGDPTAKKVPTGPGSVTDKLEALDRPVIAAINGLANGGGVEMALACDFRIAADTAAFGFGEINIGNMPGGGGTARLFRLIGVPRAKEMIYFGKSFDAARMYSWGLVNRVVPGDQVMKEAQAWAEELKEKPPLSLKMVKSCIDKAMGMDIRRAVEYEAECLAVINASADAGEGVRAFVEKRKPVFKGR